MANTFTDGTTASGGAFCTATQIKAYLNISGSDDDTLFAALAGRATEAVQKYCGRDFTSTTYTEYYDGGGFSKLVLDHRPIVSVASVYDDRDRAWAVSSLIAATDYLTRDNAGIVEWLSSSSAFPSTSAYFADGQLNVKITYTAGYASIPDAVVQASIMLVAVLYHRGQQGADGIKTEGEAGKYTVTYAQGLITPEIAALLEPYKEVAV